jgi:Ca-activated chloride channel family protein
VTGCSVELEGRNIEAKIQKKKRAEKLYKNAIEKGKSAFLLAETKPDIFQLKVGNLPPGSECGIRIHHGATHRG